jgi:NO-binding membrane sensor protein with MHYT domain
MVAYAVVNAGLVALVISLAERRPFLAVLVPPLPANALHFLGNTVIGMVGAIIWSANPLVFPVVVVPIALAFVAYRLLLRNAHRRDAAGIVSA